MDEDDEFGDLYTDVLRPFQPSAGLAAPSQFQSRPIDLNVNSDDEEILYGASDSKNSFVNSDSKSHSNSAIGLKLSAPSLEKTLPDSGARGFDLNLETNVGGTGNLGAGASGFGGKGLGKSEGVKLLEKRPGGGVDFMEEDDLNIVVEEGDDNRDVDMVEKDIDLKDKKETMYAAAAAPNESAASFLDRNAVGEMGAQPMIPGLSGRFENRGGSNFEDEWESDESEDDLQIVLNDNHGPLGMERMPGVGEDDDDGDGDPLVIVADNGDASLHHHHQQQMIMDEQEWGGEDGGSGADGEKKELGDAAKASGGGGTSTPAASVQPKLGYSNHMYQHPYHSQFKYVRPGVAPLPGAPPPVAPGGIQGQVRPPPTMGPVAGRGRGDWRPAGVKGVAPMQKGFHPGYGTTAWGANTAGRGYGSGLDFTLPSHKTIFEVDIDAFEEKPWKLQGIDVSDFFNFGLSEESWKDYCKQLDQLRLETTMQSKIRVYESGRAEQDYDPDLPPELAAAVGGQDISTDNVNPGKTDAGPNDLARSSARGRPPVLIGRPIPVETGSGDRLPSIDTRRQRTHDTDAIIEIVCQGSVDDPNVPDPDSEPTGEDTGGVEDIDGPQQDDAEKIDQFSHTYNGPKREPVARRASTKNILDGDEIERAEDLPYTSDVQDQTDTEIGASHEDGTSKGRGRLMSPSITAKDNDIENETLDDQNESFNSEDGKQDPPLSSSAVGSDEEQAGTLRDDVEESVMDDRGSDMEKEMAMDATANDAGEDGKSAHSMSKGNISSRMEQLSQENDGEEETARSTENSKAISGSSKDYPKFSDHLEDEVLQERHPPAGNAKRLLGEEDNVRRKDRHERDETGRQNMAVKGREDSHSHRDGDPNAAMHRQMKSDSAEQRKDSDVSEGSWRRRDEDLHGRRIRAEDPRKRDHGGEIGSKHHSGEIGSKNRVKVRENERSERDERRHIRNELDNSDWRGANHDRDLSSRQRDRDDNPRPRDEKLGDLHNRRRKEAVAVGREHAEKEEAARNYREGSSHRKRERDDSSDQRKRDDSSDQRKRDDSTDPRKRDDSTDPRKRDDSSDPRKRGDYAKLKDDDQQYVRQKREGSIQRERSERQRDRDEWNRPKQSHEENLSRREREETRPIMRSVRTTDDKTWTSHPRGKEDYKVSVREYHSKDVGRHGDQLKRKDRAENEKHSQSRGNEDVYARGNQVSDDEKRARSGRSGTNDERAAFASDNSRLHEHRQKDGGRKARESESGDHKSLTHSRRNEDEHGGPISDKVNTRVRTERESGKDEGHAGRQSSRRHREETSTDDEQGGGKKGRSKLERWTSHKERDFGSTSVPSSLKKSKDVIAQNSAGVSVGSKLSEEPSRKVEDKPRPSGDKDTGGVDTNNANAKVVDDKHLDTVAKLKKRSERFKLPMPSEKDAISIKKMESEPLPSTQTENHQNSEIIKSERPARKRRWTGN